MEAADLVEIAQQQNYRTINIGAQQRPEENIIAIGGTDLDQVSQRQGYRNVVIQGPSAQQQREEEAPPSVASAAIVRGPERSSQALYRETPSQTIALAGLSVAALPQEIELLKDGAVVTAVQSTLRRYPFLMTGTQRFFFALNGLSAAPILSGFPRGTGILRPSINNPGYIAITYSDTSGNTKQGVLESWKALSAVFRAIKFVVVTPLDTVRLTVAPADQVLRGVKHENTYVTVSF